MAWPVMVVAFWVAVVLSPAACVAEPWTMDDDFATTPFDPSEPRWCERYHHGHWEPGAIRFSTSACTECDAGGALVSLSCGEDGCDPCGCAGSPCSKAGDPLGNAVVITTTDRIGTWREASATFLVERVLPVGGSHLGLYVALHPHCHMTVQSILVPDRPGVHHLNVAAFNAFVGGAPDRYEPCRRFPLATISDALARDIELVEGRVYTWTLRAVLEGQDRIATTSEVRRDDGVLLARATHVLIGSGLGTWYGVAGGATRFGFGAQLTHEASPSGGAPSVRLLGFRARVDPPSPAPPPDP